MVFLYSRKEVQNASGNAPEAAALNVSDVTKQARVGSEFYSAMHFLVSLNGTKQRRVSEKTTATSMETSFKIILTGLLTNSRLFHCVQLAKSEQTIQELKWWERC